MMKNKISAAVSVLLALILLTGLVSAFGVSYIWGSPLKMHVGESKNIYITLQNRAGEIGDVDARVDILEGQEFVEFTDDSSIYLVPYDGEARVNFTVSVPETAEIGDGYWIKLSVTTVSDEETGGMGFALGSGKKIYVEVVPEVIEEEFAEESPEFFGIIAFILIAIVIVAVILIVLVKRKLKK
jgi:hypothetical protein